MCYSRPFGLVTRSCLASSRAAVWSPDVHGGGKSAQSIGSKSVASVSIFFTPSKSLRSVWDRRRDGDCLPPSAQIRTGTDARANTLDDDRQIVRGIFRSCLE